MFFWALNFGDVSGRWKWQTSKRSCPPACTWDRATFRRIFGALEKIWENELCLKQDSRDFGRLRRSQAFCAMLFCVFFLAFHNFSWFIHDSLNSCSPVFICFLLIFPLLFDSFLCQRPHEMLTWCRGPGSRHILGQIPAVQVGQSPGTAVKENHLGISREIKSETHGSNLQMVQTKEKHLYLLICYETQKLLLAGLALAGTPHIFALQKISQPV